MSRSLQFFIISFLSFSFTFTQIFANNDSSDIKDSDKLLSNYEKMPYDVLSYELELDISEALHDAELNKDTSMNTYFTGKQIITFKMDSAVNMIYFNFGDMTNLGTTMTSAKQGDVIAIVNTFQDKFIVATLNGYQLDDTLTLTINYSVNRKDKIGAYLYPQGDYGASYKKANVVEPLFYTQSQYSWARYWMPCNDKPYDKALSSIAITVPNGFIGVSNGNLDSVKTNSGENFDTETFYWSLDSPISTYLMAVSASKFGILEQEYVRYTNDQDTVPIKNYAWQIDIDAPEDHPYDANLRLKHQPNILRYFSSIFGEYPFDSYGTVAVTPFIFGGMENNTITTINRDWLQKDNDYIYGLAHEVAHHWFGDLITCATWDDVWINEGAASWCESLWLAQYLQSSSYYTQFMMSKALSYIETPNPNGQIPIWGIPEDELMDKVHLVYEKSAFVYHMLSLIIGQDEFFDIMTEIFAENRFISITTDEYIELIKSKVKETKLNMDLDLFFDEWIFDSGHIQYEIEAEKNSSASNEYTYDVTINQVQEGDGFREVYVMPIDIVVFDKSENEIYRETVMNDKRSQTFTLEIGESFGNIVVDDTKVLCENLSTPSSVADYKINSQINISPNPVNDILTISNNIDFEFIDKRIEIINIKGETMMDLILNNNEQTIDVSSLISGTYFVKIGNITKKFIKL